MSNDAYIPDERIATLREGLETIARGEGSYNQDMLKHAENVINSNKEIARQLLDLIENL